MMLSTSDNSYDVGTNLDRSLRNPQRRMMHTYLCIEFMPRTLKKVLGMKHHAAHSENHKY
jgi:hypothetical protein